MDPIATPLKPCPFCGGQSHLIRAPNGWNTGAHQHAVACMNQGGCGVAGLWFSERCGELRDVRTDGDGSIISSSPDPEPAIARAVAWWNRRVSGAAAVATLPEPVGAPAVVGGGPALHGLQRVAR